MKKFIIFFLLVLAACATDTKYTHKYSEFDFLQEDMVDREAEFLDLYKENTDLKYEADSMQRNLRDIVENAEKNKDKLDAKPAMELPSPKDRIGEDQIQIDNNRVILDIDNIYWGYMLDSNSMDPLLDDGATILTVKPSSAEEISIGDLLVFKVNISEYNIVHRVMNISTDQDGIYYITKGDNNPYEDPLKIRFKDVVAIVVGILY